MESESEVRSMNHNDCNFSSHLSNSSKTANELILKSDMKNTTKTILEDVCSDFESIDVISPNKNNKILVIQKMRLPDTISDYSCDGSNTSSLEFAKDEGLTSEKPETCIANSLPHDNDLHERTLVEDNSVQNHHSITDVTTPISTKDSLQQENCANVSQESCTNVLNLDSSLHTANQLLSGSNGEDQNKIIMPNAFPAGKDLSSSLAELADAEIVQTGDNSVSIIITNPRLIKVMTSTPVKNADSSEVRNAIIDASDCVPEKSNDVSDVIIGTSVVSETNSQPLYIDSPAADCITENNSQVLDAGNLEKKLPVTTKKVFTYKGKTKMHAKPNLDASSTNTKARRISAKMKAEWAKELESTGRLPCPIPGCFQTFVTIANFQTHYKWCSGKKDLKHCLYCDSLIFSSHKSVLHHMEVEHPEKIDEYKAKYPEGDDKYDGQTSSDAQFVVSGDENAEMYVEEVPQKPVKSIKKRKFSAKENHLSPKRAILKHKMKNIKETVIENIKEFKKCVRFDNIIHKINSVSDVTKTVEVLHRATDAKFPKQRRRKLILTESIVEEKKYFEDDDDSANNSNESEHLINSEGRINTKSRLVLNMERYKRYNEYLKLTRDWASERRTYSRSRHSDSSSDSSYLLALQNEFIQDTHQLNDSVQSTPISLEKSESEIVPEDICVQTVDAVEATLPTEDHIPSNLKQNFLNEDFHNKNQINISDQIVIAAKNVILDSAGMNNHSVAGQESIPFSRPVRFLTKERVTCYSKANQIAPVKTDIPRKQPLKIENIITYGMTVPKDKLKVQEVIPAPDFDSLMKTVIETPKRKRGRRPKNQILFTAQAAVLTSTPCEVKHTKEDGIKQPVLFPVKRKRGRPPKIKTDAVVESNQANFLITQNIQSKNEKKYVAKSSMVNALKGNTSNRIKTNFISRKRGRKFGTNQYRKAAYNKLNARSMHLKQSKHRLQDLKALNKIVCNAANKIQKGLHKKNILRQVARYNICKKLREKISVIQKDEKESIKSTTESAKNNDHKCLPDGSSLMSKTESVKMDDNNCLSVDHNYSYSTANGNILENNTTEKFQKEIENSDTSVKVLQNNSENLEQAKHVSNNSVVEEAKESNPISEIPIPNVENESLSVKCPNKYSVDGHELNNIDKQIKENIERGIGKFNTQRSLEVQTMTNKLVANIDCSFCLLRSDILNTVEYIIASVEQSVNAKRHMSDINDSQDAVRYFTEKPQSEINCITNNKVLPNIDDSAVVPVKQLSTAVCGTNDIPKEQVNEPSEIKIKRPRGRPRKNQNKGVNQTAPGGESLAEISAAKEKSSQLKESASINESMTKSSQDLKSAQHKDFSVRKSERVRKRKLTDDLPISPPKVDSNKKENDDSLLFVPKKTGKRGRPRKYPPKEIDSKATDYKGTISSDVPSHGREKNDDTIRKCSRKGRPRKCVRYADINSGIDSSESLDGIGNTHARVEENNVEKQRKGAEMAEAKFHQHKEQHATSDDNGVSEYKSATCVSCKNCICEQAEKLILPPKKRKQVPDHKDHASDGANNPCSCNTNSEKLQNKKKNEKPLKDENSLTVASDEELNASPETSRNLRSAASRAKRNSSLPARKKKNMDYSDGSPKRSADNETSNNFDQSQISEHGEGNKALKRARFSRRSNGVNEGRNLSYNVAFKTWEDDEKAIATSTKCDENSNIQETEKPSQKYSWTNLLQDFKPKKCMWKLLTGRDYDEYMPPLKRSALLKIEKAWSDVDSDWFWLNCFESAPPEVESRNFTFFTGGPVWSSAWCPTPVDEKASQYIALATSNSLNSYHSYASTDAEKGLLQLWNVGQLDGSVLDIKPSMQLGISHNHGIIWDMAWCPSGCWENPAGESSDGTVPRLGLLAVACSDSYIRIYSVPHPNFVATDNSGGFPLFCSWPSAVLKPLHGEPSHITQRSMCVSLSWQKTDFCERIAGGYGNGMICIWLVTTSATILTKDEVQKTITPYLVFQAHGTPVTSVSFAPIPGSRWLLSSSFDKTLKFWDLIDSCKPFFTLRKGIVRSSHWPSQWGGVFANLDDGMSFKGPSFFKDYSIEQYPVRILTNHSYSVMKSSVSECVNAQAIADVSGAVSVSFTHGFLQDNGKYPNCDHYPVFKIEMQEVENYLTCNMPASQNQSEMEDIHDALEDIMNVVAIVDKIKINIESNSTSNQSNSHTKDERSNEEVLFEHKKSVMDERRESADTHPMNKIYENICEDSGEIISEVLTYLLHAVEVSAAISKESESSSAVLTCDSLESVVIAAEVSVPSDADNTDLTDNKKRDVNSHDEIRELMVKESNFADGFTSVLTSDSLVVEDKNESMCISSEESDEIVVNNKIDNALIASDSNTTVKNSSSQFKNENLTNPDLATEPNNSISVFHNSVLSCDEQNTIVSCKDVPTTCADPVDKGSIHQSYPNVPNESIFHLDERKSEKNISPLDEITEHCDNFGSLNSKDIPGVRKRRHKQATFMDVCDNSLSDNDIETDDSDNHADSVFSSQETDFSDDSLLSEYSVSSNSSSNNSVCSFSCESSTLAIPSKPPSCELQSEVNCTENSAFEDISENSVVSSRVSPRHISASSFESTSESNITQCAENLQKPQNVPQHSECVSLSPRCSSLINASNCCEVSVFSDDQVNKSVTASPSGNVRNTQISDSNVSNDFQSNETKNSSENVKEVSESTLNRALVEDEKKTVTSVLSECNVNRPVSSKHEEITLRKDKEKMLVSECGTNSANVCVENERFIPSKFSSYESVASKYGLVFKDMDLVRTEIPIIDDKDMDSFPFDQYHLSSFNTVTWNPNYGCHLWLLSAGQSGVARISSLSGIRLAQEKSHPEGT